MAATVEAPELDDTPRDAAGPRVVVLPWAGSEALAACGRTRRDPLPPCGGERGHATVRRVDDEGGPRQRRPDIPPEGVVGTRIARARRAIGQGRLLALFGFLLCQRLPVLERVRTLQRRRRL